MASGRGIAAVLVALSLLMAARTLRPPAPASGQRTVSHDGAHLADGAVTAWLERRGDDWLHVLLDGQRGRRGRSDRPPLLGRCTYALLQDGGIDVFYWQEKVKSNAALPLEERRLRVPRGPFGSLMTLCNGGMAGASGRCEDSGSGSRTHLEDDAELITAPLYLVLPQ